MFVNLLTKFQVSNIILTSFREGNNVTPHPQLQNEPPKKPNQIRVKVSLWVSPLR